MPRDCPHLSKEQLIALLQARDERRLGLVWERDPAVVVIVAAPEGVAAVEKAHPTIPIYAAALDRELNAKKYILPGLGDFGDRLYGT